MLECLPARGRTDSPALFTRYMRAPCTVPFSDSRGHIHSLLVAPEAIERPEDSAQLRDAESKDVH